MRLSKESWVLFRCERINQTTKLPSQRSSVGFWSTGVSFLDKNRFTSSLLSVSTASEWRCQASNCSSPRIVMPRSGYRTCKQAEQRKQQREAERGGGGVLIMCKSITYRKQFSLAQVERKLEKFWHTHTHTHVHAGTQACTHTYTEVV